MSSSAGTSKNSGGKYIPPALRRKMEEDAARESVKEETLKDSDRFARPAEPRGYETRSYSSRFTPSYG